ncbi:MAG: polysaccharide deacetylase family protein [Verrucomicrobiota bacterium]
MSVTTENTRKKMSVPWHNQARLGWAAGFLVILLMLTGCEKPPASFPTTLDPGDTIYFVPVREKITALTFDDGPNEPFTGAILDSLRKYGVHATFFMIGANAERLPETARRIAAEGHVIGCHTYSHPRFDLSSSNDIMQDITSGSRAITAITGITPSWFRPSYGINGPGMEESCRINHMAIAGWSLDAEDWNPHSPEEIAGHIVANVMPGDIIRLHDGWETHPGGDRQNTARAVPLILEQLRAAGYTFVTLPELLRRAGPPLVEFANGVRLLGLRTTGQPVHAGNEFQTRYCWDVPAGWDDRSPQAFVHFLSEDYPGLFQDDHPIPSRGDVRDRVRKRTVAVPSFAPPGRYQFNIGLFDPRKPGVQNRIPARSIYPHRRGNVRLPMSVTIAAGARRGDPAAIPSGGADALTWTSIDVNSPESQGDAHLIQVGKRAVMLIDTGHPSAMGMLLRWLNDHHVRNIEAVLISHGHRDHYGNLTNLIANGILISNVFFNPPPSKHIDHESHGVSTDDLHSISASCRRHNIPVRAITGGTEWSWGSGITMKVLYAFDGVNTPAGETDINDMSAIMLLTCGKTKVLFTGDLNAPIGRHLVKNQTAIPIRADILKAPHHGTEGTADNDFFQAVNPDVIVVPAPVSLWQSDRSQRIRKLMDAKRCLVNGADGDITVRINADAAGDPPYAIFVSGYPMTMKLWLSDYATKP